MEDQDQDEGEGEGYLSVVDDVPQWENSHSNISPRMPTSKSLPSDLGRPAAADTRRASEAAEMRLTIDVRRRYELLQRKAELLRQLADLRLQARGLGLDVAYEVRERDESGEAQERRGSR